MSKSQVLILLSLAGMPGSKPPFLEPSNQAKDKPAKLPVGEALQSNRGSATVMAASMSSLCPLQGQLSPHLSGPHERTNSTKDQNKYGVITCLCTYLNMFVGHTVNKISMGKELFKTSH